MRNRVIFLLLLLLSAASIFFSAAAQPGTKEIGQWQVHVPYNRAKALAEVEGTIYCATEDGFFSFDPEFNQLKTLSKADGFHGIRVSTLAYSAATQTLVIAYADTHLDLLRAGKIIPISDIARHAVPGEKKIDHIYCRDQYAYLAGTFGLAVLDLEKLEIKETYGNLGSGGQARRVYASTTLADSIYLATSQGLMAASLSAPNLLDYKSWQTFGPAAGLPATVEVKTIATFANRVYAGLNGDRVYRYTGKNWLPTAADLTGSTAYQLTPTVNHLLIVTQKNILLLDAADAVQILADPLLPQPRAALQSPDQTYWLADYSRGLIHRDADGYAATVPAGPFTRSAFSVYADDQSTFVLEGGYDQAYEQRGARAGFYEYAAGQWLNYTSWLHDARQLPALTDLTRATRHPTNGKLYLGSYGGGLLEWTGLGNYKVYNPTNSPLLSSLPNDDKYTRVPDVAADATGNVWVVNRHQLPNRPGLHVLRPDATWQSFTFPGFADGGNLERLALDDVGFKWLTVSRNTTSAKGLLVFDDRVNQFKHLTPANAQLPSPEIYALAKDRDGAMWVGTNNGLAVFQAPEQAFAADFAATLPIVAGRPVLEGQVIRAIAVDGGNRKWIGTEAGVWLLNDAGDQVLAHFTAQNSPLLADKIIDISLNHKTGEVFIATEAGLVSYRGAATVTAGKPDCATVFPNPVRPGYEGLVGISGLPNNAHVKITDSAGRLVYETQAAGGTVAWNVRDGSGRRVPTGVYLVFSATLDGRQSCISKIAVVE